MTKSLQKAIERVSGPRQRRKALPKISLPMWKVEHLRAELQNGIDSLDHDLGREFEIEQLIRAARTEYEGQIAASCFYLGREQTTFSRFAFRAGEWSAAQADRHLRDIDDMFERLREEPELGRKRDELIEGLRSIRVMPQLIFYTHTPQAIGMVRVLHQRFDDNAFPSIAGAKSRYDSHNDKLAYSALH